jgi:TatD DNase family protein
MSLTDTHCHLDFNSFDADRDLVVERAKNAGLDHVLNPGIDVESSQDAIRLAESYEIVYAAVGLHPNDSEKWSSRSLSELRDLASAARVVAIGEIGLDYYRNIASRERQLQVFQEQLDLAADCCLPVIVHNRDASEDTVQILCEWQQTLAEAGSALASRPGVLHAFSGTLEEAERVIKHHFLLGVDGPLTYRKADSLRQVISAVPIEHLLIETDSPFLTPHPYRGSRNEPMNVKYIVEKLSQITNLPVSAIETQTSVNAGRIFQW